MSSAPPPEPLPSATVVLLRNAEKAPSLEVLLLQRSSRIPDRPGSWVFPGGRVDDEDYAAPDQPIEVVARTTAVRETHEEAGLRIEPARLTPISRWITPEMSPYKRFDTWFFVADLGEEATVTVDGGEIVDHRWLTPAAALECHHAKEIELPPPTFVTITWLSEHGRTVDAIAHLADEPLLTFRPQICPQPGGACMLYPGDAGYETRNPDAPGARHRLWTSKVGYRYERTR